MNKQQQIQQTITFREREQLELGAVLLIDSDSISRPSLFPSSFLDPAVRHVKLSLAQTGEASATCKACSGTMHS
jgi:hypothetical protein